MALAYSCHMKIFLTFMLILAALPAYAQIYKWTDANGHIHYSDHPQDGVNNKALQAPPVPAASAPLPDDWQQRDRASREKWARQTEADRRAATVQQPFNPSVHRSNTAMSDEELCQRDRQQIDYAKNTPNLSITHGNGEPQALTEAQRQEVISERTANHALTCGAGA